jgi:pimeloyl-ACP methyl ester carboxylesterase
MLNLNMEISYPTDKGVSLPVVALMAGWKDGADSFSDTDIKRIADYGFMVVVVSKRGNNGGQGTPDASGREIYDICDAVNYVRNCYPYSVFASQTIAAIVGYSGGGGNALAAACKFPDFWSIVVDYFGISDYGYTSDGWWQEFAPGTYRDGIEAQIGGSPATVPNNYRARHSAEAIANYTGGHVYVYHDVADVSVKVIHSQRIISALAAIGNCTGNISTSADAIRWFHSYPTTGTPLIIAETTWSSAIKNSQSWTIPTSGTVTVIGYIVTKLFAIWLNTNGTAITGIDAVATVTYNTASDTYTITPLTTGGIDVVITQGAKTGSATNISTETEIVVT